MQARLCSLKPSCSHLQGRPPSSSRGRDHWLHVRYHRHRHWLHVRYHRHSHWLHVRYHTAYWQKHS